MAKQRDYKREYELAKQRGETTRLKNVGTHVSPDIHYTFKTIAKKNGTTPGTLIKEWILQYIAENRD